MPDRRRTAPALLALFLAVVLASCSAKDDVTPVDIPAASMSYVVLAWSAQGMHFLDSTYNAGVLSAPYNTLVAQVVRRGDPPQIVTTGVTVEYSLVGNTSSYGKTTTDPVRNFSQFWDNAFGLYGVDLAHDTGLNLVDPGVHNGLTGTMLVKDGHFQADGIPVVPLNDAGTWDPYQVAEVVVRDASTHAELARTRATVETSDEINCAKCHGQTVNDEEIGSVLQAHDDAEDTAFVAGGQPVLCASCHDSLALGRTGSTAAQETLSYAIHIFHYDKGTACYDCHPGATTMGSRSTAHTDTNGQCTTCHGSITTLAATIAGGRVPWASEPKCVDCHTFVAEVDTGTSLYRDGIGHGGLSCPACHGPAHAQVPSNKESDNYQAVQYQSKALAIGSCKVCHEDSKGGGLNGIVEAHGGSQPTSCRVCHTGPITTTNPSAFPHKFQARRR